MYELTGELNAITLHCDNESALKLATRHQSHNRSKHIRYHFIRDLFKNKITEFEYLSINAMSTDLFTKSLLCVKHYKCIQKLGIIKDQF